MGWTFTRVNRPSVTAIRLTDRSTSRGLRHEEEHTRAFSSRLASEVIAGLEASGSPKHPDSNANNFWRDGGVAVSQIHRAKGNEAEMVHVVGFDLVARDEGSINLRNGLFVAPTRSRGWARLSGVGESPMCEEMRRIIAAGNTFTFTFSRAPQRDYGDEGDVCDPAPRLTS